MADFKTHTVGASLVSGVAATLLFMTGAASNQAVVGYFFLGVTGGLLPDIDSDTSIPLRIAFNLLAIVAGFLVIFSYGQHYSLVELLSLWLVCVVVIRYGVFSLFTRITAHRGLIHSLPAGACFALLSVVIASRGGLAPLQAWLCGAFVLTGFIVHLLLDEFYSVNLTGMRLKNSFGTALSMGSLSNIYGTIVLYLAVIGLFFLSPSPSAFVDFVADPHMHHRLLDRLLPEDAWFQRIPTR